MPDLDGKVALITGAGGMRGVGRATVMKLAGLGADIALSDVHREVSDLPPAEVRNEWGGIDTVSEEVQALGRSAEIFYCDLSDPQEIEHLVEQTMSRFGRIDILVNNAGIAGPTVPSWEYPVPDWQNVIDVDLNAVYYCCRAVIPMMREQDYGRVVNVASIAGKEGNPNAAAYSAAKAGVIALTKSIAKETADLNIAVNCISPAAAKTRIFDQISQQHIDYMLSKIPRGRFVLVEEIAAMVAWMVSEENSFTTGAAFDLSGGRATY